MSDMQLSDLFAEGTAPESDPAFARRVAAGIGRARRGRLAARATVVLALSAAAFVAAALIKPVLAQLADGAPRFMGVPAPVAVVLGVLVAGLALRPHRYVHSSDAGVGFLDPIE